MSQKESTEMKLLVTGATGFLGRNLINFLVSLKDPLEIICLVRNAQKAEALAPLSSKIQILRADLLDREALQAILPKDLDRVFHLAALVGLKNGSAFYDVNTTGMENLVQALSGQTKLQRFVYISSIAAIDRPPQAKPPYPPLTEQDPPSPRTDYGKSKQQAEEILIRSGLPYSILRPAYIFGPYPRPKSSMDRVIYDVHSENPYTKFPYTGRASEIYVEDLAEMIWHVGKTQKCLNEIYFVANQTPITVKEFFQALYQLMQKPYKPYPLPKFLTPWLKKTMIKEGLDPILGEILFHDYFVCDPSKLYRDISYRPYYGFGAGLSRTLQWYREQGLLER